MKKNICPFCESYETVNIVYGSSKLKKNKEYKEGRIHFIDLNDTIDKEYPDLHCKDCHKNFSSSAQSCISCLEPAAFCTCYEDVIDK